MIKYQNLLIDEGYVVVSWQGIRRDESIARRNVLQIEDAGDGLWQYRPIADWTAEAVFDLHKINNVEPNPLYKLGMSRVGCMPCINAVKGEIREIAKRFPEHIKRIAEWEKLVSAGGKCQKASFFSNLDKDPIDKSNIHAVIVWSKTLRGGRVLDPEADQPAPACSSSYGLCE